FDMDGLLFDTEPLWARSLMAASAAHGFLITEDQQRPMLGCSWPTIGTMLLELHGRHFPVDRVRSDLLAHFHELAHTELTMKPGLPELVDYLDELDLPFAIATSSNHE